MLLLCRSPKLRSKSTHALITPRSTVNYRNGGEGVLYFADRNGRDTIAIQEMRYGKDKAA
jgi:hypothetical protein